MKTVPEAKLSQAANGDQKWAVYRSNFPFGPPNKILGYVNAADKRTATLKAEDHYGRDVIVQPAGLLKDVESAASAQ